MVATTVCRYPKDQVWPVFLKQWFIPVGIVFWVNLITVQIFLTMITKFCLPKCLISYSMFNFTIVTCLVSEIIWKVRSQNNININRNKLLSHTLPPLQMNWNDSAKTENFFLLGCIYKKTVEQYFIQIAKVGLQIMIKWGTRGQLFFSSKFFKAFETLYFQSSFSENICE